MSPERQPIPIDPNKEVRQYVEEGAEKWEHQKVAVELYKWSDVFRLFFFSPSTTEQPELPRLLVGVEPMNVRVLAAYHLKENAIGLPYEITFNQHYISRPLWELNETLLHELIHLYQENAPGLIPCKDGYHNAQFVVLAESVGLHPLLGSGAHWRPADGQFERLMGRYGVERPRHAEGDFPKPEGKAKPPFWWDDDRGKEKLKGKSTLILYTCEDCIRKPMACKIRSGRDDLDIKCNRCGGRFVPQT